MLKCLLILLILSYAVSSTKTICKDMREVRCHKQNSILGT